MASEAGQTAVVTLLLDHGADLHAVERMVGGVCVHFVSVFRPTKLGILNVVNFMERAPIEWPVCVKFFLMRTVVVLKVGDTRHSIIPYILYSPLFYKPLY